MGKRSAIRRHAAGLQPRIEIAGEIPNPATHLSRTAVRGAASTGGPRGERLGRNAQVFCRLVSAHGLIGSECFSSHGRASIPRTIRPIPAPLQTVRAILRPALGARVRPMRTMPLQRGNQPPTGPHATPDAGDIRRHPRFRDRGGEAPLTADMAPWQSRGLPRCHLRHPRRR